MVRAVSTIQMMFNLIASCFIFPMHDLISRLNLNPFPGCFQDRRKLPWHGADRQNAVHSWSGEVSAPAYDQKHICPFIPNHTHTDVFLWHTFSLLLLQRFMRCVCSWPPWTKKRSSAGAVCAHSAFLQRAQLQKGTNLCSLVDHQVHPWG